MADAQELKKLRKAAKKAAAELAAAVEAGEDAAEQKTLRKAAKKAAAAAAAAEEPEEPEEQEEEDPAEAKRKRKEAKKAAKAAAAVEAEEEAEEEPAKKKKKKAVEEEGEEEEEAPKKKNKKAADEDEGAKAIDANHDAPNPFRMFVGGIAWNVEEEQLRKDFSECGEVVDIKLLMDRESGKSRGIAFITMADQAGFDAVLKYDGEDYAGRPLNVSKANSTGGKDGGKGKGKGKDGKDGKGKGKKGIGDKPAGCTSIVVKGLAYEATEEDLREVFGKCKNGPTNINLLWDEDAGKSRGVAFIDFDDTDAVDEAMKLTETFLKGRSFFLRYSDRTPW